MQSTQRLVVFDGRGLVVGHEQRTKSVPLRVTFALTIPTGGPPRALTASAPQHHWGLSLLNPLPHTLHAANDIDAGMHGLEQRGTPMAVGQRTLAGPERFSCNGPVLCGAAVIRHHASMRPGPC